MSIDFTNRIFRTFFLGVRKNVSQMASQVLAAFVLNSVLLIGSIAHFESFAQPNGSPGIVRAENYVLDIQSGRIHDQPRIRGLWATGHFVGLPFKVTLPCRFVSAPRLTVHYDWSSGSLWAGLSEKVELQWRRDGQAWRSETLGEGFRDPSSGHLLLFPVSLDISSQESGTLELKFILHLQNGETIQDGGERGTLSLFAAPQRTVGEISFNADWSHSVRGVLKGGQSFELIYDPGRLTRQMNLQGDEPSPWSVVARIQFDDRPTEEYPVVVLVSGSAARVVSFVPTVFIPPNVRRMAVWFSAFHDSQSYFDSNYGTNFNFDIISE